MKKILSCLIVVMLSFLSTKSQEVTVSKDVFTKVDKEAKFPGGLRGWQKYLEANLDASLGKHIKLKRKESEASLTVIIQFLVDKSGAITDINCINRSEVHPKLAREAIRVIAEGPRWEPAEQNGRKVIYQAVQHITFQVVAE